MINLWMRHIAWRVARRAPTPSAAGAPDAPVRALAGCVRCGKPRDDGRFKLCSRCRTRASLNQTKRRKRLALKGACVKCGRPRDSDHIVCSPCRARERRRYYARAGRPDPNHAPP